MARMMGRNELLQLLGTGGMGETYLARRRGPGGIYKTVVVKRIRRSLVRDARYAEMFVEEARLSMALTHRNIVPVFDFGSTGQELFLVMDYVRGLDLGRLLGQLRARGGSLSSSIVAYIGIEASAALHYAHGLQLDSGDTGIVHRDVTPQNIMLSAMGEIKLMDFGVAARLASARTGGKIRGTPAYMSPEQARGDAVDERSDLFSLGLILWEALAGERAYPEPEPPLALEKARMGRVPALPVEVPGPMRTIVERAVSFDPLQRFASAREMQLALDRFLVGVRAHDEQEPPSHQLAYAIEAALTVLREQPSAGPDHAVSVASEVDLPAILEGGDGKIGTATARSIAETMADPEPVKSPVQRQAKHGSHGSPKEPNVSGETMNDGRPSATVRPAWTILRRAIAMLTAIVAVTALAVLGLNQARHEAPTRDTADTRGSRQLPPSITFSHQSNGPEKTPSVKETLPKPSPTEVHRKAETEKDTAQPQERETDIVGAGTLVRDDDKPRSQRRTDPALDMKASGTLKISSTPWSRVEIPAVNLDCPETPCILTVPAGDYLVELENVVTGQSKRLHISIQEHTTKVVHTALESTEPVSQNR